MSNFVLGPWSLHPNLCCCCDRVVWGQGQPRSGFNPDDVWARGDFCPIRDQESHEVQPADDATLCIALADLCGAMETDNNQGEWWWFQLFWWQLWNVVKKSC